MDGDDAAKREADRLFRGGHPPCQRPKGGKQQFAWPFNKAGPGNTAPARRRAVFGMKMTRYFRARVIRIRLMPEHKARDLCLRAHFAPKGFRQHLVMIAGNPGPAGGRGQLREHRLSFRGQPSRAIYVVKIVAKTPDFQRMCLIDQAR